MSVRLFYDQLPDSIKSTLKETDIHKSEKKGTSTIVVHLKIRTKQVWRKLGDQWFKNTDDAVIEQGHSMINTPRLM